MCRSPNSSANHARSRGRHTECACYFCRTRLVVISRGTMHGGRERLHVGEQVLLDVVLIPRQLFQTIRGQVVQSSFFVAKNEL